MSTELRTIPWLTCPPPLVPPLGVINYGAPRTDKDGDRISTLNYCLGGTWNPSPTSCGAHFTPTLSPEGPKYGDHGAHLIEINYHGRSSGLWEFGILFDPISETTTLLIKEEFSKLAPSWSKSGRNWEIDAHIQTSRIFALALNFSQQPCDSRTPRDLYRRVDFFKYSRNPKENTDCPYLKIYKSQLYISTFNHHARPHPHCDARRCTSHHHGFHQHLTLQRHRMYWHQGQYDQAGTRYMHSPQRWRPLRRNTSKFQQRLLGHLLWI